MIAGQGSDLVIFLLESDLRLADLALLLRDLRRMLELEFLLLAVLFQDLELLRLELDVELILLEVLEVALHLRQVEPSLLEALRLPRDENRLGIGVEIATVVEPIFSPLIIAKSNHCGSPICCSKHLEYIPRPWATRFQATRFKDSPRWYSFKPEKLSPV